MWLLSTMLACKLYGRVENFVVTQPEKIGLERHVIPVEGGEIAYWEGGNLNGETVLWLHGFGGDALWAWSRNLKDFSKTHHIIAPDLLWFGESTGGTTLDAQAQAVEHILHHESVEEAHVIALSYGGFVGLKMVPSGMVTSMVLIGVGGVNWGGMEVQELKQSFSVEQLEDLFVPSTEKDVRRLVDVCFFTPTILMPPSFDAHLYGNVFGLHPNEQRLLIRDLETQSKDISEWIAQWDTVPPALVVIGRQDPIFTVSDARILSSELQGELAVVSFADHVPQVEHARRFRRVVRRFLNSNAHAPSPSMENMECCE